ncbi:MAG: ornithine cyclodeaminase family protein [Clostridia bacterium]
MSFEFKTIDENTVKEYLTIADIINRVEITYKWYSEGKINMPSKITTDMHSLGVPSWINAMPSYVQPCDTLGLKWAGGFTENAQAGKPYIKAVILVTNPRDGELEAVIAGDWISDIRTGAQTAVAAKYLAVNNPQVVTLIGAGVQSFATALCLCQIFKLKELRISDINPASCKSFVEKARGIIDTPIKIFNNNQAAVLDADIIVTATAADTALVKADWVKPGVLISSIGSYQELDDELIWQADKLVVDHLEQNVHRGEFAKLFASGKLEIENIWAEIGDIVAGRIKGRVKQNEKIIISPIGMGCLDISIAGLLLEKMQIK